MREVLSTSPSATGGPGLDDQAVSGGSSPPPTPTREEQLVQLLLRHIEAAKAMRGHVTIFPEIQVSDGELRSCEIKHVERWQPAGTRKRTSAR